jgi:hypothetical protein
VACDFVGKKTETRCSSCRGRPWLGRTADQASRGSAAGGQRRRVPLGAEDPPQRAPSRRPRSTPRSPPSSIGALFRWKIATSAPRRGLRRVGRLKGMGTRNHRFVIVRPQAGLLICRLVEVILATSDAQAQLRPTGTRQASVGNAIGGPSQLAWPSCAGCSLLPVPRLTGPAIRHRLSRASRARYRARRRFTGGRRARVSRRTTRRDSDSDNRPTKVRLDVVPRRLGRSLDMDGHCRISGHAIPGGRRAGGPRCTLPSWPHERPQLPPGPTSSPTPTSLASYVDVDRLAELLILEIPHGRFGMGSKRVIHRGR